jgi:DNA-directed RNA polymerase subunit delta
MEITSDKDIKSTSTQQMKLSTESLITIEELLEEIEESNALSFASEEAELNTYQNNILAAKSKKNEDEDEDDDDDDSDDEVDDWDKVEEEEEWDPDFEEFDIPKSGKKAGERRIKMKMLILMMTLKT